MRPSATGFDANANANTNTNAGAGASYPEFPSHFLPRTAVGRLAVAAFLFLFLLAEPPFLFVFANRIEPWVLGVPFLYGYLALVYFALIAVLLYAHRRGV